MPKKSLSNNVHNAQNLDIEEQLQFAESEVRRKKIPDGPFSLSSLKTKTKIPEQDLLYWAEVGILNPRQTKKVKRVVKEFSSTDFENALFAQAVKSKSHEVKPQEIRQLIQFWRILSKRSRQIIYKAPIDQFGRAQQTLLARLLAIEVALVCGFSEAPKNILVVVRRFEEHDAETNGNELLSITSASVDDLKDLLSQDTPDEIIKGISTPTGEMLVAYIDAERTLDSIEGRRFSKICLHDIERAQYYEMVLGFHKGTSIHPDQIRENLTTRTDAHNFLIQLLRFTFSTVLHLNEFTLKTQPDVLHFLAEAATLLAPNKWDYCGILVPKDSSPILRVVAWSSHFPELLQNEVFGIDTDGSASPTLPVWVFKNNDATVVNQVVNNDPRILQVEAERVSAAAAVPATSGNKVVGVIYVASRRLDNRGSQCFDHIDLKLLRILGQIIGEMIERDNGASRCANNALKIIPEPPITFQESDDLQRDISVFVENLFNLDNNLNSVDSFIVLTIGIDGILQVASRQKEIVSWISEKVQEKTHRFLTKELAHDLLDTSSLRIYKSGLEQIVALLSRTKEDHRRLRADLEKNLAALQGFGTKPEQIKIDVWSLEFKYSDLFQKIKVHEYSKSDLAKELWEKVQGSLNVLENIREGNKYLNGSRYDRAFWAFETAHRQEPANPYVLRHMAQCKIILKQYDDAIRYAEQAVQLDGKYAGSHVVLGDAYIAGGNYEQAVKAYKDAISLNPNHAPLYLGFGQALVLDGNCKHVDEALQALSMAMSQDSEDIATLTKYLRLMAETCILVKDFERATRFLDEALGLLPNDRESIFLLKLAKNSLDKDNHTKAAL